MSELASGYFWSSVRRRCSLRWCRRACRKRAQGRVRVVGYVAQGAGRGADRLLTALGGLYTHGQLGATGAHSSGLWARSTVPLPTYPFERQRYWLEAGRGSAGDASSVGLLPAEHPLLGASIAVAEGDSFVFTGRLSLAHACRGLPGTWSSERCCCLARRLWSLRWQRRSVLAWTRSRS